MPESRAAWQEAFRYVMVDEYQDTNHAQFRLVSILAAEHRNIAVVGDHDQSIYAFRGADIRNIAEFEHDFPNARVVALEQNYRSTQTILDAANAVIAHNPQPAAQAAVVGSRPRRAGAGGRGRRRARRGALRGRARSAGLLDEGASAADIAVFYRMNAQSRVLEDLLVRQGVGYRVIGGPRFYERAEIKDAIAYLQLLRQPRRRGVAAADREPAAARHRRHLAGAAVEPRPHDGLTLLEAIEHVEDGPLGAAATTRVAEFAALLQDLADRLDRAGRAALLEQVLTESGYMEMLEAERTFESQGRIENLQELVGVAREFEERGEEDASLATFLQEISLYSDQDALQEERGAVTLMTLHNAKGLEFPIVFMIGLEEGLFPASALARRAATRRRSGGSATSA